MAAAARFLARIRERLRCPVRLKSPPSRYLALLYLAVLTLGSLSVQFAVGANLQW